MVFCEISIQLSVKTKFTCHSVRVCECMCVCVSVCECVCV